MSPTARPSRPDPTPNRTRVPDRTDTTDLLHGVRVADPYRWLEDPEDPRTSEFVAVQNAISEPYLEALPARARLLELTTAMLTAPRGGVPWERGGRYFVISNPGALDQDQVFVSDDAAPLVAGTAGRLLLDPNAWSTDGTAALTSLQISRDGALAAYARSDAGSDWRTIQVVDVATGQSMPDRLEGAKWVDPTWLPDGASFLYWQYPDAETTSTGAFTDATGVGVLVLHRLGDDQSMDTVIWSRPEAKEWQVDPWLSNDGRFLVLVASPGTDSRTTVSVRRLITDDDGRSQISTAVLDVVTELTAAHHVVGAEGDTLYLWTDADAPTGRLVAVDLARPASDWVTLATGSADRVLTGAAMAADTFVLIHSVDTAARLEMTDRAGKYLSSPELGDLVSISALRTRSTSTEIFVGTSGFDHRLRVHRLGTDGSVAELEGPAGAFAAPRISAHRSRGRSADGTEVPMSLVHLPDLPPGPRPTLLYGYGGFDIPLLPSFSAMFGAWIAAGGVLAVANLRGGGEFGRAWHEAGMLHHKQRVFDDFIGCAQTLIADGITTRDQLAIHGRSNGGLLVGAVLTQRPDLFAAALPTVGVMDMLRFHLFTIGWAWTSEYGTPEDAADFAVLQRYSPLHSLRPGTAYPPTLIATGDHDDRVVPAHSLKFAAEMQHCQVGDHPILLRVDTRAGHGMGKPARALALEYADQLAFAARWTGLVVKNTSGSME